MQRDQRGSLPTSADSALLEVLMRIHRDGDPGHDSRGRAAEVWRGLSEGQWGLSEHIGRDGNDYYLAHELGARAPRFAAQTRRETEVLHYVHLGHSNKLIAHTLGVSISSVSTYLRRARLKLASPDASLQLLRASAAIAATAT